MTSILGAAGSAVGCVAGALFGQVGVSHNFVVMIDNGLLMFSLGSWSKVSGLSVTWKPCEYRYPEQNHTWVYPGNAEYTRIKLSRAAAAESKLVQQWLVKTTRNNDPQSGSVQMINFMGLTVVEWKLKEFFPVGWSISDFDSNAGQVAIETLELAHTGFLDDEASLG